MTRTSSSTPTAPAPEEQAPYRPRPFGFCSFQAYGRMVSGAELRYTSAGKPLANFTVAMNDRAGQPHYLDVVLFGAGAETLAKYGAKGRALVITGRIATHSWEAQDGSRRKSVDLIADQFHFADRSARPNGEDAGDDAPAHVPDDEPA